MDSPSFKGFHVQLDCKFTHSNKNQIQLTHVWYIKFHAKKQYIFMKNITWHNC